MYRLLVTMRPPVQVVAELLVGGQPGSRPAGRGLHQLPLLHHDGLLLRQAGVSAGGQRRLRPGAVAPLAPLPLPHPAGAVHTPLGHRRGAFAKFTLHN